MVTISEKSLEEKTLEREIPTLVRLTIEKAGEKHTHSFRSQPGFIDIFGGPGAGGISVNLHFYKVSVYSQPHFDLALALAQLYESRLHQEFTLKKEY